MLKLPTKFNCSFFLLFLHQNISCALYGITEALPVITTRSVWYKTNTNNLLNNPFILFNLNKPSTDSVCQEQYDIIQFKFINLASIISHYGNLSSSIYQPSWFNITISMLFLSTYMVQYSIQNRITFIYLIQYDISHIQMINLPGTLWHSNIQLINQSGTIWHQSQFINLPGTI